MISWTPPGCYCCFPPGKFFAGWVEGIILRHFYPGREYLSIPISHSHFPSQSLLSPYYRVSEPYWTHEDLHKSTLKAFFQLIPLLIILYTLGARQNFALNPNPHPNMCSKTGGEKIWSHFSQPRILHYILYVPISQSSGSGRSCPLFWHRRPVHEWSLATRRLHGGRVALARLCVTTSSEPSVSVTRRSGESSPATWVSSRRLWVTFLSPWTRTWPGGPSGITGPGLRCASKWAA